MSARAQSWVVRASTFLFACGLAFEPLYHIVRGSINYTIFPQDDFYYYYLTAKNLALHGISSFDGIVATNGYHPLWLWLQSLIVLFTRESDRTFFVTLEILQIASAIISAELLMRLLRRIYGESLWIYAVSLGAAVLESVLIFTGMETVLCIPLLLWFAMEFINVFDGRRAFVAGLAGTLLVLSRIDTILCIVLAVAILLSHRRGQIAFFVPFTLLFLYVLSNQLFFHNWLPVSSQVKQLEDGLHFNLRAIEAIRTPRGSLYFLATVIGLVLIIRNWTRDAQQATKLLLLVFAILFTLVLALRVGWSAYMWYFYPFPISAAVGILEIRDRFRLHWDRLIERGGVVAFGLIVLFSTWFLVRDIPMMTTNFHLPPEHMFVHAEGIESFTSSHPGRYAMGDRAGVTAFVTGQPILQVEGLAADQAMVDSIRSKANLLNVLRKYGVKYYIVSYPLREFKEQDNVWDLQEPHWQQVEPYVPVMRARFYAPEVYRYPLPVGEHATDSSIWVTRILDVSQAKDLEGK
jgi:hypothetical protein